MKLIRTIAAYTDHSYYGDPIENTTIELYADQEAQESTDAIEILRQNQNRRMLEECKRMPHAFWRKFMQINIEIEELESKIEPQFEAGFLDGVGVIFK